jgi:F-type H+-transporting ATPase subunit a
VENHGPLAQFEIKRWIPLKIGDLDVSFTNSSAFMVLAVACICLFLFVGMRRRALVPGRWQSMVEMSYLFVANLVRDTVGPGGRPYFPVPYAFTFTSHIVVTFAMAVTVFAGVTIIAIAKHGLRFFSFFVPPGVHWVMWPLLIPIEVISYLSRPISLSVRLFANMLAGHTLLKVFAGFVISLGLFGVAPLAFVVALTGLEFVIAFLQAFVFTILTCLYLNDALHLH